MSFFNLRRGGTSSKSTASLGTPAESLEIVRKRAKHRLIGSAVLVLLGVIGFPLLFDTQPRPVSVGIPIEIPSKQGAKPLSLPPAAEQEVLGAAPAAASTVTPAAAEASTSLAAPSATAPDVSKASEASTTSKPAEKVSEKATPMAPAALATKPSDDAARAKALLNGTSPAAVNVSPTSASAPAAPAAVETRLVVQVGAFADAAKAREARLKLEKAGLKTYTQVAETKDGKRIRVRVGPYATKAEADKAAKQIKALDLPAAILTL